MTYRTLRHHFTDLKPVAKEKLTSEVVNVLNGRPLLQRIRVSAQDMFL